VSSLSFDRAAGIYDATRGLPAGTLAAVVEVLANELRSRPVCLEIGVGTGRIALPLHDAGVALLGADVSVPMLERLLANAGGRSPFPLMRADVTALPLAAASVDAVLASHVLHLIPAWQAVVDESRRVLRPGGALLVDFGGGPAAPWSKDAAAIMRRHAIDRRRPGVSNPHKVASYLGGRAELRPLAPVSMTLPRSLAEDLDEWEHQIHSWTWPYSAEQMAAACGEVRRWAIGEGLSLDTPVELRRTIQWWAYDIPR
jgi:ubiquinone/menaquinone biosynthesis C-methylase UbiE